MTAEQATAVVLSVLTAVLSLALSATAWSRRRQAVNRALARVMLAVAWWAATTAAEWLSSSAGTKVLWSKISYLGIATSPALWWLFAREYAGRPVSARWHQVALWALPVVLLVMVPFNERHGLVWPQVVPLRPGPDSPLVYHHGPLVWALTAYAYVLLLFGAVGVIRAALRAGGLYHWQVACLCAGVAAPWVASALYMFGPNPVEGFDLAPVGFSVSGVALWIATLRFRFLDLAPIAHDAVFAQMPDPVLVTDRAGLLAALNPAAEALLGIGRHTVGQSWDEVVVQQPALAPVLVDPPPEEVTLADAGAATTFHVSVTDLHSRRGHRTGRLIVFRDITARRLAEQARLELDRQVQATRRMESLVVLAAGLAHDYNNILTAIIGNAELAASMLPPDATARGLLSQVVAAADRATSLTTQMLAYAGRGRGATTGLDVVALAREVVATLGRATGTKPAVHVAASRDLPLVTGDASQVRFLVQALLTNAIEAQDGPSAPVELRLEVARLTEPMPTSAPGGALLAPGEYVSIAVADSGCGMDEATLAQVFDPFFSTKFLGRGLGLAAVLGIVGGHDGGIRIVSRLGQGTTVTVWLPVTP